MFFLLPDWYGEYGRKWLICHLKTCLLQSDRVYPPVPAKPTSVYRQMEDEMLKRVDENQNSKHYPAEEPMQARYFGLYEPLPLNNKR